ncbi:hypothetical protein ACFX1R_033543 [Malus domestica]
MSDVPSSPVFLGGEEYPLDGEAVRGDIKEWLTTLEGVYLGLLLCRTDPLPAFSPNHVYVCASRIVANFNALNAYKYISFLPKFHTFFY